MFAYYVNSVGFTPVLLSFKTANPGFNRVSIWQEYMHPNVKYAMLISQQFKKNVNNLEFGDYIWNNGERCMQISTNMPAGIGLEICKILRNKFFVYIVIP